MTGSRKPPEWIHRHFRWLLDLGFEVVPEAGGGGNAVLYRRDTVLVHATYDWRDEVPDLAIARRREAELRDEPYWGRVPLVELLERRDPGQARWAFSMPGRSKQASASIAFARAAELLRADALDLLEGRNLEVLDEIVAARPHFGVPGFDYPTDEPWAASAEGMWFATDHRRPRNMATVLELSQSADPKERVVAALKIPTAGRFTKDRAELSAGLDRLWELLADDQPDVRRAAGSALGEWPDPDALDQITELLAVEPGDRPSPLAAAATFLAIYGSASIKTRVLDALAQFAERGEEPSAQVEELAWRIDPQRRQDPNLPRLPRRCTRWLSVATTDSLDGTEGVVDRYARDVVIPTGQPAQDIFRLLEDRLLIYQIFPPNIMRADVCSNDGRIHEGTTIVQHVSVGPLWREAAVRVVRVWQRPDEAGEETGFSYATLEGHPERGVSTFCLRRSLDGDKITFLIDVRSRPGSLLTRLARPFARRFQRRATEAALAHFTRLGE